VTSRELTPVELPSMNGEQPEEPRTSWAPVDLGPVIDGDAPEQQPSMLTRTDGACLLYPGKLHSLQGEPEAGKGWVALRAVADQLPGHHVVYIDFEDSPMTAVTRLLALGVEPVRIRSHFHYARPDEPLSDAARADLEPMLALGPTLVVLDGVTEALTQNGLDLRDNLDVARWLDLLPRRLTRIGIAVLQIDHVTKDPDTRRRYAIGAQHKLAGVDVSYTLEAVEPFGRGREGISRLVVGKDRPGYVRQFAENGERVADVRFCSGDGGHVRVELDPPSGPTGGFQPTLLMERVSRAVEANPGVSKSDVRAHVKGKSEYKDQALALLIAEGYVEDRGGDQGHRYHGLRPYRESRTEATS